MEQAPIIPAQPKRDFRTRRVPLRVKVIALAKRLGILGAAVAVPSFAAPGSIAVLQPDHTAPAVQPMPFEIPGQGFPGSAFYYLEDTPQLVEYAGFAEPVAVIGEPAIVPASSSGSLALAAPALRIAGSDRDHARAQECMAQAIYYEAASESDAGQRAVAQVVLNRVAHQSYPGTVCGVVYQGSERSTGCQFTFTCDGSLARRPAQAGWNRASRIAREALAGVVYAGVGTATHYHTLAVNPYWAGSLESVGVIGSHIFYRWPGAAGEPDAFRARYAGGEPAAGRARANAPGAASPSNVALGVTTAPVVSGPGIEGDKPVAQPQLADTVRQGSGSVRPEYANSGRWIAQPSQP